MKIEKIEVEKVGIPKINSLPTTPQITRELNVEKPGFDFIFPFFEPMRYNPVKMQTFKKPTNPTPPDDNSKSQKNKNNNTDADTGLTDIGDIEIELSLIHISEPTRPY